MHQPTAHFPPPHVAPGIQFLHVLERFGSSDSMPMLPRAPRQYTTDAKRQQMQTPKSHLSQPASKAGRAKLIQVGASRALQADGAWAHDVCAAPARQTRTGATFVVLSVGAVDTRRLAH